ncbi:Wadjet anti-phage system protein JetD domain-containing protein [Aeromonas dhakensis]|uniref:Wadjet anti-phage system protein JetD domain-containing protein n=1 Tax=Aeromonas dhakensis TaxID=196024 RepID=UPI003438ADC2
MSLFDERRVQDLCARLLEGTDEKGYSLDSKHGRGLRDLLQAVGGVKSVGRGARYVLTDAGRAYLAAQLAQVAPVMPNRRDTIRALGANLPARLNLASFHALWYGDSKSGIGPDNDAIDITLTQDEVVRLRTMSPLLLIDKSGQRHDMTAQLALLGELVLPERCLCKLQGIEWQGQQIVTVENKGALVDYPLQAGELLLYVPGRNTRLVRQVIPLLPAVVPWAHFGDLEQRGLDIAAELANALRRPLALWLPDTLMAYVHHYACPLIHRLEGQPISRGKIPWGVVPVSGGEDRLLAEAMTHLVSNGLWLEQEVLVLAEGWQSWQLEVFCEQCSQ